jgi:hypothetical protein
MKTLLRLIAAARRRTGLHPLRRLGEPHYDSTADVIVDMRRCGYRRVTDDRTRCRLDRECLSDDGHKGDCDVDAYL